MDRKQIMLMVEKCVIDANFMFPTLEMRVPKVEFYQKGRAAGWAHYREHMVRFNEVLAKENTDDFGNTVSHEIAHLVVGKLYPAASAHGKEFRYIHRLLGGTGARCHSYDVSSVTIKKTVSRYIYSCDCKERGYTKQRHNKISAGIESWRCKKCGCTTKFTGNVRTIK